jgi:two-component system chemotaxis response regulator CheB
MTRSPRPAVRVLLVDDSPTVRAVLKRLLGRGGEVVIAGEASNGEEAVEAVRKLRPDVVLMDLEMPVLDGPAAIQRIMAAQPTPILVLTAHGRGDQQAAFQAMRAGAVDLLPKPIDPNGWQALQHELPVLLRATADEFARRVAAGSVAAPGAGRPTPGGLRMPAGTRAPVRGSEGAMPSVGRRDIRYVAVGASTGGPVAIRDLLEALPAQLPAAVLIVQHITAGFEEGLAEWLGRDLRRDVRVAKDGELARPGSVRFAPNGTHLVLERGGVLRLDAVLPPRGQHRPSADELFFSCARVAPRETAGVLLTGMGRDGAEGLLGLRQAGGLTMVQDAATASVWGMPKVALDRGAADLALAPREIARVLARCWEPER